MKTALLLFTVFFTSLAGFSQITLSEKYGQTELQVLNLEQPYKTCYTLKCSFSYSYTCQNLIPNPPKENFLKNPDRTLSIDIILKGGILNNENKFSIRASKTEPLYFIDGVKTRNSGIPIAAVGEIYVGAQSVPSDIGDTGAGFIIIETLSTF